MTATPLHPAPHRVTADRRDDDPTDGAPGPGHRAGRPADHPADHTADHLRTALPVTLALLLLAGVAGAGLWALHGALAFGVWFLGAG